MKRIVAVSAVLIAVWSTAAAPATRLNQRINLTDDGRQGAVGVLEPLAINDDGQVVVFTTADYLSSQDREGVIDVYAYDRRQHHQQLASVAPAGGQDPVGSQRASVSGDGRFVAYTTSAGAPLPLPPGAIGTYLYVKDRLTGNLERVVIPGHGEQGFSTGDGAILDGHGHHLAFTWSDPALLVSAAYVQDRTTGVIQPVSIGPGGRIVPAYATSISDDGRFVAFVARPSDVVRGSSDSRAHVFVRDLILGTTRWISVDVAGGALPGDYSGLVSGDGTSAVVWQLSKPGHIFHKSLASGAVQQVDVRDCRSQAPSSIYALASISDDGRTIAFQSATSTLVADDTNGHDDVFVWRASRPCSVDLVSRVRQGIGGNGDSYWPALSGDGRSLAFVSEATNLVTLDTNARADSFVRSLKLP